MAGQGRGQRRVEKIRAAKAAVEAEAAAMARKEGGSLGSPSQRPPVDTSTRHAPRSHAAQFHRSGQSEHEGAGRIHPRLYRQASVDAAHQVMVGTRADEPGQRRAPTRVDAGAYQAQHGPTGAGTVGECGGLLRAESHRADSPPRSRICRPGSAETRHGLGHRRAHDRTEDARPRDDDPPETHLASPSLSAMKTGGRTGGWPDQTGSWFQTVLAAGPVGGRWCVEFAL